MNRTILSRRVSRRAMVGAGLGLAALPLIQACGGAATPSPAAKAPAGAGSTPAATQAPAAKPATADKPTPGAAAGATTPGATPGAAGAGTPAAAGTGTPAAAGAATTPGAATTGTPAAAGTPGAAATKPAGAGTPAAGAAGTPAAGATGTPAAAGAAVPASKPVALTKTGGTVNVLATWGGDEQANFLAMVKPFEDQTGAKIQYEGTRDLNAVLTTRVAGGNPPDVAGLPGPGQMAEFAKQGKLTDLSGVLDMNTMRQQYSEDWMKLAAVDGKQVGIFIKAAMKGLIWYNPAEFQKAGHQIPKTWDELMQLSQKIAATGTTPWSIGLESAAASGWPGTDWIEDIVLRQAGTEVYDGWHQGKVKWSSDGIKKAWQEWGKIVGDPKMVFGGKQAILATNFGDAANPLFQSPPKAFLHHQANFLSGNITKNFPNLKAGTGFDVFPFPDIDPKNAGAIETAGDLFGMFKSSPPAAELMKWLVSPEAQGILVQKGGALSPNRAVQSSMYPDPISQKAGQTLANAKITRFDASDLMPEAMNNAFWKACLDFVNNPSNLDSILANLDKVQADSYKS